MHVTVEIRKHNFVNLSQSVRVMNRALVRSIFAFFREILRRFVTKWDILEHLARIYQLIREQDTAGHQRRHTVKTIPKITLNTFYPKTRSLKTRKRSKISRTPPPTLSGFAIQNDETLNIRNWLFFRLSENIFDYLNFPGEYK